MVASGALWDGAKHEDILSDVGIFRVVAKLAASTKLCVIPNSTVAGP